MSFFDFFTSAETLEILEKLLVAFLLSLVIGAEREFIHKPAGIKTHTLICISACLVMSLGIFLFRQFPAIDPSRLPAQILAGIGFVGAGTIIRDGFTVKGITTAASLLAITCIGLTVGAGYYTAAFFATLLIFLILSLSVPIQRFINGNRKTVLFTITAQAIPGILGKIESVFNESNVSILSTTQHQDEISQYALIKVFVTCPNIKLREKLIQEICELDFVKEIYTSKRAYQHDSE